MKSADDGESPSPKESPSPSPSKSLVLPLSPPEVKTIPASPYVSPSPEIPTAPSAAASTPTPVANGSGTSESNSPLPSPKSLIKLASLAKPSFPTHFKRHSRNARHSIDVRALPSYLAKKRQSAFGQFLTVFNPSAPDASISSDEPLFEEPIAPTLSLGERVAWVKTVGPEFGAVKWIGRMPQISNEWTVGVEFDNCIGAGDGTFDGRRYFVAKENFAKFLPLSSLTKVDNYVGRPRTGTMLSRMSVQLKPGQLISVQRSPSVHIQHCTLNAPHHVGHDVHGTNMKHCLCPSCNHPCAHLCKTRKPKGRRTEMAHMCHFSSKPHAKMCCGGEDLPCATQPILQQGTSWMHYTDMASLRTIPVNFPQSPGIKSEHREPRRKSVTIHDDRKAASAPTSVERDKKEPISPLPIKSDSLKKHGSELSISSLPSSTSPAEVYIARGVLTDESDIDTSERSSTPSRSHSGRISIAGLRRSLASCFVPPNSPSSVHSRKKKNRDKEHAKRNNRRKHGKKRITLSTEPSPYGYRKGHRRGVSSDTSNDGDGTHCSHCQTSSALSGVSSKARTNPSPTQHKSTSTSPPPPNSPHMCSDGNCSIHERSVCDPIAEDDALVDDALVDDGPVTSGDENEGLNEGVSSVCSKSGNVITTYAHIESTHRSQSSPSHSTTSDCLSPRRRKKGPAPPPPSATSSASPTSLNLSVSSLSLPQSPTNNTHNTINHIKSKRRSYKKHPVPTPPLPNLTRSLSEQKQLNLKNVINAVPTFRSEIDLKCASRKSQSLGQSIDLVDNKIRNYHQNNNNINNNREVPQHNLNDNTDTDTVTDVTVIDNTDSFSENTDTITNNTMVIAMNEESLWSENAHIGRLMEELEVSIAHGEHRKASALAKELAMRKVSCSLNRLPSTPCNALQPIIAYLYIEDSASHRGPIPLQVYPTMSVNMLKIKVEKEFNIPMKVQRWVLGKASATNLDASLATYGITCSGCSIFLYLLDHEDLEDHEGHEGHEGHNGFDSNDSVDHSLIEHELTKLTIEDSMPKESAEPSSMI